MIVVRLFLGLAAAMLGVILVAPIVALGLPFMIVASATRFISSLIEPKVIPWQQLIEYEPTVGWKPKANLNAYANADGVFHLTTDKDGWRGQASLDESDIVVFGDSFAFGYGADDGTFYAECNSSIRVKAIGVNGYNMVQEFLWMERLSTRLKGKLVVWMIYFGNDLYENLQPNLDHYTMPFVRTSNGTRDWEIISEHVGPARWLCTTRRRYYDRLAEICCPTFLSERAFSASEAIIKWGRDLCDQAGAELVVMTIPDITQLSPAHMEKLLSVAPDRDAFDPDLPDKRFGRICEKLGVPVVALKHYLGVEDYLQRDVHWNERGHRKVSQILNNLLYPRGVHTAGGEKSANVWDYQSPFSELRRGE